MTRWRSARTAAAPSPAATTGRCGCGTWPPASRPAHRSPATTGGVTAVAVSAGRPPRRLRRRRRDGAGVGPGHRRAAGAPLTGHDGAVSAVAVSAGRPPRRLRRRRRDGAGVGPGHRRSRRTPSPATTAAVRAVAVSADGRRAVSGGDDGTVRVWDLATGEPLAHPHRPRRPGERGGGQRGRPPRRLRRRRRDGAGVGPGHRRSRRHPLTGHDGGVSAVAVSADGRRAVSGGDDGTVRVWDLATGAAAGTPCTGHDGGVHAVAVERGRPPAPSPAATTGRCGCGTWPPARRWRHRSPATPAGWTRWRSTRRTAAVAVSGGDDGTVRVWDLATGDAGCTPLTGHAGGVSAVAVSAGRPPRRLRRRRRDGAGVGPGHRRAGRRPAHRPRPAG